MEPLQIIPAPHSTPIANSHISARASCPGPASVPTFSKPAQTAFHIAAPAAWSALIVGEGAAPIEKKTLFKHWRAHVWIALSAEVIGGLGEGRPSGGNESGVGWMRERRGSTRVVRKESLAFELGVSTAMSSSCTSLSSSSSVHLKVSNTSKTKGTNKPPSKTPSSISSPSSSCDTPKSGSGSVAQTPVRTSKASDKARSRDSILSSSSSVGDLWSVFRVFLGLMPSCSGSAGYMTGGQTADCFIIVQYLLIYYSLNCLRALRKRQ